MTTSFSNLSTSKKRKPKKFSSKSTQTKAPALLQLKTDGLNALKSKDLSLACQLLGQCQTLFKTEPELHYYYALALGSSGQYDEAIEECQLLLEKNPKYLDTYEMMIDFGLESHQYKNVMVLLKKAEANNYLDNELLFTYLGKVHDACHEYDKGYEFYKKCKNVSPQIKNRAQAISSQWIKLLKEQYHTLDTSTLDRDTWVNLLLSAIKELDLNMMEAWLMLQDRNCLELTVWAKELFRDYKKARQHPQTIQHWIETGNIDAAKKVTLIIGTPPESTNFPKNSIVICPNDYRPNHSKILNDSFLTVQTTLLSDWQKNYWHSIVKNLSCNNIEAIFWNESPYIMSLLSTLAEAGVTIKAPDIWAAPKLKYPNFIQQQLLTLTQQT